jgi:hypothetical protein
MATKSLNCWPLVGYYHTFRVKFFAVRADTKAGRPHMQSLEQKKIERLHDFVPLIA